MPKIVIADLPMEEELQSEDQSGIVGGLSSMFTPQMNTSMLGLRQSAQEQLINPTALRELSQPRILLGPGKFGRGTVMCPW